MDKRTTANMPAPSAAKGRPYQERCGRLWMSASSGRTSSPRRRHIPRPRSAHIAPARAPPLSSASHWGQ
eukprot:11740710-Prorocentrum_lima.AAC.1